MTFFEKQNLFISDFAFMLRSVYYPEHANDVKQTEFKLTVRTLTVKRISHVVVRMEVLSKKKKW